MHIVLSSGKLKLKLKLEMKLKLLPAELPTSEPSILLSPSEPVPPPSTFVISNFNVWGSIPLLTASSYPPDFFVPKV